MKRIFSLFFSLTALSFSADAQYQKIITIAGTNPPGGYGGAPGGHLDEACAVAAIDKVKDKLK